MIDFTKDGGLWIARINRPDKANSLTHDMLENLAGIAEEAQSAKAFILTGTGKIFSAGADLNAARSGLATSPVWERLSMAIANLPCLTIAALNGTVAGGAMGMVLACDIRIATPDTNAFYPVMKLGFLPQPSDPKRLNRLIGPARTRMILLAGARVNSQQALDWGLFDQLAEPDQLMGVARNLTTDVLAADPDTARQIKHMTKSESGQ